MSANKSAKNQINPNNPAKKMPQPPVLNKPVIIKPPPQNRNLSSKVAATPTAVSIDIHDLETGRVQTAKSSGSGGRNITLEEKIALVKLSSETLESEDRKKPDQVDTNTSLVEEKKKPVRVISNRSVVEDKKPLFQVSANTSVVEIEEKSDDEEHNEISAEIQAEIDKRNYLQMLEDAKANSKNLGEMLRKKGAATEEKRGYTLADFMDIENVKRVKFNETDYNKHKKLYMMKTKNVDSLLFLSQTKMEELFDRHDYTSIMKSVYDCVYILPLTDPQMTENSRSEESTMLSDYPMDELFMWSLLVYSGKDEEFNLIKYYWSLTSKPIACAFAAIIVFERFRQKSFVCDELKAKLEKIKREFETYACDLFDAAYEEKQAESEDLILNENPVFYNRTALDMAIEAGAREFMKHKGIQKLLTLVWYEKINYEVSKWKIFLSCAFIPITWLPLKIFNTDFLDKNLENEDEDEKVSYEDGTKALLAKKALPPNVPNPDLPFRCDDDVPSWLSRPIQFLNAPIIKFVHHLVYHLLYIIFFAYFMLFQYYPVYTKDPGDNEIRIKMDIGFFRVKYTDIVLVLWVTLHMIEFLRQMFLGDAFDLRLITRIKNHFSQDPWNVFDVLIFIIFYIGVGLKLNPTIRDTCLAWDESCVEIGRVCYSVAMIMSYIKTLRYLSVLPEWGPKLLLLKELIRQLTVFVILLGLVIVPYSVAFQTIVNGSQNYQTRIISRSFYFLLWPIFGHLNDVVAAIQEYECPAAKETCNYGIRATFLYISFGIYVIVCNLLIFNMIISIFCLKTNSIKIETEKAFSFKRYLFIKEYSRKTIFPAPLALIEYIVRFFRVLVNLCNGQMFVEYNSFAIQNIEEIVEREYARFEHEALKKFLKSDKRGDNEVAIMGAEGGKIIKPGANAGFENVFQAVEQSKMKNEFEKNFKLLENKLNAMQTVTEKTWKKVSVSNNDMSLQRLEELKSSIDYLTHYLITNNIDILEKEHQVKKATAKY